MRVHSDVIETDDVRAALSAAKAENGVPDSVRISRLTEQGSTKRDHAFDVSMTSRRMRNLPELRYRWQATWTEWGWFIAHLFAVDPDAVIGPYRGKSDFHAKTDHIAIERSGKTFHVDSRREALN